MKKNTYTKKDFLGLETQELMADFKAGGFDAYRVKQVRHWAFQQGVQKFDEMKNIPKALREWLDKNYSLAPLVLERVRKADDRTRKFLFGLEGDARIESVLMPADSNWSLCVSSQAGCSLDCKFCATAGMKFRRNLKAGEIVAQVIHARRTLKEMDDGDSQLTNLVFMGMGEPLINFINLRRALTALMASDGLDMSHRRITVSTAGWVPGIKQLAASEINVSLAVSLNAASQKLRMQIMPGVAKKFPLDELMAACRAYPLPNRRRITFEYVLLDGVNTSNGDALGVAKLLRGIRCKVNLIPFNEMEGLPYKRPSEETINRFGAILRDANYTATVRRSKGENIRAACGQLASAQK